MSEGNGEVPEDRQILIRIGINLDDVIIDDDDIYGNGVNVAAWLETLAETDIELNVIADGIFGCLSSLAVKCYQEIVGLDSEGIVDTSTSNTPEL